MNIGDIQRFLFSTLRGRLILGVALVHAVMMTLFIVDLTARQRAMLLERQEESAHSLAETLSTSASSWLAANDIAGLQELVEVQRRYPELIFAILADKDGKILAHTDQSRQGQLLLDLPSEPRQTVISTSLVLVDVAVPALLGGQHVGWARVGIGQKTAEKKLAEIIRNGALYALAAIVIGSLIAWRMGLRITGRLYAVQETISRVHAGDSHARSPIKGSDEAALLAGEFNAMLDVLDAQSVTLAGSEAKYRLLLQNIRVAVIVHGPDTQILMSNSMAQTLLGLNEEQMRGKETIDPVWRFLMADGTQMPLAEFPVNRALGERRPILDLIVGVQGREGGTVIWTLVNASPQFDEQGGITEVVVTFVDITERKKAEKKIIELNEELEDRVRERTAELEKKSAELEKANRLFVGRELRMIELKEKIVELERKIREQ
jgi:PAS domain S-box-containing protein